MISTKNGFAKLAVILVLVAVFVLAGVGGYIYIARVNNKDVTIREAPGETVGKKDDDMLDGGISGDVVDDKLKQDDQNNAVDGGTNLTRKNDAEKEEAAAGDGDEMANWKTYKDSIYGFALKYPDDYYIQSWGYGSVMISSENMQAMMAAENDTDARAIIIVHALDSMMAPKEWAEKFSLKINNISDVTVGQLQVPAIQYIEDDPSGEDFITLIQNEKKNALIKISRTLASDERAEISMATYGKIVSSFIFTDDADNSRRIITTEAQMEAITSKAITNKDIKICDEIYFPNNTNYLNGCIAEVAEILGDEKICDKIPAEDSWRRGCYQKVAAATKNVLICDKIIDKGTMDKNDCYKEVAVAAKNADICKKIINNDRWRDTCFYLVASDTNNSVICNLINDSFSRKECIDSFEGKN